MTAPIQNPDALLLEKQSSEVLTLANVYTVTTAEQFQFAADELKNIKASIKAAEKMRKEATGPLDAAKKTIMEWFRPIEDRYATAETKIKAAMLTYQREEERKRQVAEAAAREAARKEQERVNEEAMLAAERAQANHDTETADAIIAAVPIVQPVPVPVATPKIQGISTRQVWKFRIVDAKAVPDEYKTINEALLGSLARSTKGGVKVPGVEFYPEDVMSAASR